MTIRTNGRAQRDDVCEWCAYPFDTHDAVLHDGESDDVYCSKTCIYNHRAYVRMNDLLRLGRPERGAQV